ncbi:MAG: GNAT family N-acetyltransferase [Verrucomicrobiaceae bacterium]|nr:MAG: GNAT family N-acetyltransferase [Verrucomicrobiaceae bacterium]
MSSTLPLRFRPAEAADQAWLAGRLPPDRGRGAAFVGEWDGTAVAAFVVAPPLERYEPEGLALAFSVDRRTEARVIAEQIVALARQMAARANLGPLHAWPPPVDGSPGDRAYRSLGFTPFDRIVTWEVDLGRSAALQFASVERARARTPDDPCWQAEDVALADMRTSAGTDAITAFYETHLASLGGMRDAFQRRLLGQVPDGFDPVRSRLLLLNGEIAAMILTVSGPGLVFIVGWMVAPPFRGGSIGQRLFATAHAAAPLHPGCRLRFETHDRHHGTARLARRLGATAIQTLVKLRHD